MCQTQQLLLLHNIALSTYTPKQRDAVPTNYSANLALTRPRKRCATVPTHSRRAPCTCFVGTVCVCRTLYRNTFPPRASACAHTVAGGDTHTPDRNRSSFNVSTSTSIWTPRHSTSHSTVQSHPRNLAVQRQGVQRNVPQSADMNSTDTTASATPKTAIMTPIHMTRARRSRLERVSRTESHECRWGFAGSDFSSSPIPAQLGVGVDVGGEAVRLRLLGCPEVPRKPLGGRSLLSDVPVTSSRIGTAGFLTDVGRERDTRYALSCVASSVLSAAAAVGMLLGEVPCGDVSALRFLCFLCFLCLCLCFLCFLGLASTDCEVPPKPSRNMGVVGWGVGGLPSSSELDSAARVRCATAAVSSPTSPPTATIVTTVSRGSRRKKLDVARIMLSNPTPKVLSSFTCSARTCCGSAVSVSDFTKQN